MQKLSAKLSKWALTPSLKKGNPGRLPHSPPLMSNPDCMCQRSGQFAKFVISS